MSTNGGWPATGWLPRGELRLPGWTAVQCLIALRRRLDALRLRARRPVAIRDGRVREDGTFRLSCRVPWVIHSGALGLRGRVDDVPGGCAMRYRTRIAAVAIWVWSVWTFDMLAALAVGLFVSDTIAPWRIALRVAALLLVPLLVVASLLRGRREVGQALDELPSWFGDRGGDAASSR